MDVALFYLYVHIPLLIVTMAHSQKHMAHPGVGQAPRGAACAFLGDPAAGSLVNSHVTMENHNCLVGKSTFSMVMFNSYVSHYTRGHRIDYLCVCLS